MTVKSGLDAGQDEPELCLEERERRAQERANREERRRVHLAPVRYARGYAWGFAGKPEPELAPADWTTGWIDGRNTALAILHEDSLR